MTDGSSTMFAVLPALLEQGGSSSKTSPGFLPQMTGTLWPESVRRWPKRVSSDGSGRLFERPMSGPATSASDGSVLPTPTAHDSRRAGRKGECARSTCLPTTVETLLPTPTAGNPSDGEDLDNWEARRQRNLAKGINGNGQGTPLAIAVRLLPTPTAGDARSSGSAAYPKTATHDTGTTLTDALVRGSGTTPPQSSAGPGSSVDQHQTPPSTAA